MVDQSDFRLLTASDIVEVGRYSAVRRIVIVFVLLISFDARGV